MTNPIVNPTYDVAIVGAGPAGAGYAAVLKAIDPDRSVCVVDIRPETRRSYSLSVAKDSIAAIHKVLEANLNHVRNTAQVRQFMAELKEWAGEAVSAQKIEEKLGEWAVKFGATITRKVEYKEALTVKEIDKLLSSQEVDELTETQRELRSYFRHATVIAGAAGTHCPLRQRYMDGGDAEKRVEVKNLQYFVEIKYQTDGKTKPRGSLSTNPSCEGISFETLGKVSDELKFATSHFFVGETTAAAFAKATDKATWDLERLQVEATGNPIVENMARKIVSYVEGVLDRGGSCIEPKIKLLPITVYRSAQVVKVYEGRVIVEVGDALSGAVFARGVNKGLTEAARLAQHTRDFFQSKQQIERGVVPPAFKTYETEVLQIFAEETKAAEFKATWINRGRTLLRWSIKLFTPLRYVFRAIKSFFVTETKLDDLIKKTKVSKASSASSN
jgi:hypothetical protein